jgi:hypothetical protein
VGKIDVVPIFQREIGRFEDKPDEKGPGDHQEEFFGPGEDKGVPLQAIDHGIDDEDVRPPSKAVKPTVERIDFFEEENLREK